MNPAKVVRRFRWVTVLMLLLLAVATTTLVRNRPIAAAPRHAFVAPQLGHLPALRVCWAEYARNETAGQAATAGFTRTSKWNITVSGLLIRHPAGDLVLDVGNSSHFRDEVEGYPFWSRLWLEQLPGSNRTVQLAPDAVRALGADPARLRVLISHAHVDHAGGLVDLPHIPVLMAQEEKDFIEQQSGSIHVVPAQAAAMSGRITALTFTAHPYETFDESADVFGDGSVVVVKLAGHTPGSIGTFVNLSPELRLFHIGDTVNIDEAIDRSLTKSVVMASTDVDRATADRVVARLSQLHAQDPKLQMLPAHDRHAWQQALREPNHCLSNGDLASPAGL